MVDTISCRSRRDAYGCRDAEDQACIYELWRKGGSLSESYGELFRRLVHIFESSYCRDVLVGDQDMIRLWLHECLERVHREGMCEVEGCPWLAHTCDGTYGSDYRECPLLAKEEGNVAGPSFAVSSQHTGSSEVNFNHAPDPAASHEHPPEDTPPWNVDATTIELSIVPDFVGDNGASSSQSVVSDDAHNVSTSIHSPGTVSHISAAAFHSSQSTSLHSAPAAEVGSHAQLVDHVSSMAASISPSSGCPSAADEILSSDSHATESSSCDIGESRMGDQDAARADAAVPGAGVDAAFSATDACPVKQHKIMPFTATATETEGTGSSGATCSTPDEADAVVSCPTIPTPLLVSSAPRATLTLGPQPFASLGGPSLDLTGSSSGEVRSPATATVSCGRPEHENWQDPLTSRVVAVNEPSRRGQARDAERQEDPLRSASNLFQGVRAVSRQSSEEFELAVREGHIGEDSGQDG